MGPSAENQAVAGEMPNDARLVNDDTIDVRASQKTIEDFMAGYVLLPKPDWGLTGVNTLIDELLPTDAPHHPDQCSQKKNSLIF